MTKINYLFSLSLVASQFLVPESHAMHRMHKVARLMTTVGSRVVVASGGITKALMEESPDSRYLPPKQSLPKYVGGLTPPVVTLKSGGELAGTWTNYEIFPHQFYYHPKSETLDSVSTVQ